MKQFFGKYKGVVTDNKDTMFSGRVRAKVNEVFGDNECGWATACLPFAGPQMGFFAIPPVGAGVFIEFEGGDPDRPIWSGGWLSLSDIDPAANVPVPYKKLIIKTEGGTSITLDDTPQTGGITFKTADGPSLTLSALGTVIDGGQPPGSITIKAGMGQIKIAAEGLVIDAGTGAKVEMQGPKVDVNSGALQVI